MFFFQISLNWGSSALEVRDVTERLHQQDKPCRAGGKKQCLALTHYHHGGTLEQGAKPPSVPWPTLALYMWSRELIEKTIWSADQPWIKMI